MNGILVSTIPIENTNVYDEGDPVTFKYTNTFPSFTPSGKFLVNFEFINDAGVIVGCGGIKFNL